MASTSTSSGNGYLFNRDHRSMARLNYNHWLHVQLTGYLIHPSIQVGSAVLQVADIGTGTAIYPISVSNQYKKAFQIDGFDISPAQFPPGNWLPQDVRLTEHDAFKPFPNEFREAFDIVHIRFFLTLVDNQSVAPLIQNLVTLLKPYGYIQWSEPNMPLVNATAISPSTSKGAAEELAKLMKKPVAGAETDWIANLGSSLSAAGLEVVADDRISVPDSHRMLYNISHLMSFEDVAAVHASNMEVSTQMEDMLAKLKDEFLRNGVSLDQSFTCVVARRPS